MHYLHFCICFNQIWVVWQSKTHCSWIVLMTQWHLPNICFLNSGTMAWMMKVRRRKTSEMMRSAGVSLVEMISNILSSLSPVMPPAQILAMTPLSWSPWDTCSRQYWPVTTVWWPMTSPAPLILQSPGSSYTVTLQCSRSSWIITRSSSVMLSWVARGGWRLYSGVKTQWPVSEWRTVCWGQQSGTHTRSEHWDHGSWPQNTAAPESRHQVS